MNGFCFLFPGDKVKGCVGFVKEGLRFQGFKTDNPEATSTGNTEFGFQEMDGR